MRPYRGLGRYRYGDRKLFAGREAEISSCAKSLVRGGGRLFILHGNSGSGKSSFLQAGLVPYLDGLQESDLQIARKVSVNKTEDFVIRLQTRPLSSVAAGVMRTSKQLNVGAKHVQKWKSALFGKRLATRGDALVEFMGEVLLKLPIDKRLLLIIDQGEEIFASEHDDERLEYFDFLARVTYIPMPITVLVALRSEYKAQFDDFLKIKQPDPSYVTSYFLKDIQPVGILDAIKRPTILGGGTVAMEEKLPGVILEDLEQLRGKEPILPILQVICDRLYSQWKSRRRIGPIGERDYRATGAANAQIRCHVEEKIVEFYLRKTPQSDKRHSGKVNLAEQVDRWLTLLCRLIDSAGDGRVKVKALTSPAELRMWAKESGCQNVQGMLGWLAKDQQSVLERVLRDPSVEGSRGGLRLVHDSVGTALVRWRNEERYRNELLETRKVAATMGSEELTSTKLYSRGDKPSIVTFSTTNDLIWDHLIPIYANEKGFSQRLGLQFVVNAKFDLGRRRKKGSAIDVRRYYRTFLKRRGTGISYLLVVVPGAEFPIVQKKPWKTIGIPNLYKGYAIIGKKQKGLRPVCDGSNDKDKRRLLACLAKALSGRATISAYEQRSVRFLNHILEHAGYSARKIKPITQSYKRFQGAKDPVFAALVDEDAEFVMGPAPSRALAEQAGFVVYANFDDVYDLADDPVVKRKLNSLILHENCAVVLPGNDRSTCMRLASVLFYTVQFIRQNPEDFIRFLYNQVQWALKDGYPLQREYIRRTVTSCYQYLNTDEYPFVYLNPTSEFFYPEAIKNGALSVYREWQDYRTKCDQAISTLMAWRGRWTDGANETYRLSRHHCRILNFYDADRYLRQTKKRLGLK